MIIYNFLRCSKIGGDFAARLEQGEYAGIRRAVENINKFLSNIEIPQQRILRKKFSSVGSLDQIFDKIAELLVAIELRDERPLFMEESDGGPDLYLQTSEKWVEIKRINESDDEKSFLEVLEKKKVIVSDSSEELARQAGMVNAVNKKADDALSKATKQVGNRQGIIYLIYSLDLLGYRESLAEREKQFESYCAKRFKDIATRKPIEIKIKKFNKLIFE
ncbi:MAG: hypothetical protein KGJ89_02740 [Patescibacteria group bacterium]|nr:hypothetical protein [Patescibacteria group bacterium]MDE2015533.1 hypothetical protein [Patescibacteria group bacterium]MDE2226851.1 hypothetical protein [Patescibacteria group bacterium]